MANSSFPSNICPEIIFPDFLKCEMVDMIGYMGLQAWQFQLFPPRHYAVTTTEAHHHPIRSHRPIISKDANEVNQVISFTDRDITNLILPLFISEMLVCQGIPSSVVHI